MKIVIFLVTSILIVGCTPKGGGMAGMEGDFLWNKCMKKAKARNYVDVVGFCNCDINAFMTENKSYSEKFEMCDNYRVSEDEQVIPVESKCFKQLDRDIKIGDIVEQYRHYDHKKKEMVIGVPKKYNGLLWEVVEIKDQYVGVELFKGKYLSIRAGDGKVVKFDGSWNYKDTFKPAKGNEQFMKEFKVCIIEN